jgi:simple sugar transport system permease protein
MTTELFGAILFAMIVAATPLMLVALGELVTEKAGMLNLGAEGLMAVGAVSAFIATHTTGSVTVGVLAGMTAGVLLSSIFALVTIPLMANQVATGLAIAIFGVGLAAFIGKPFESSVIASTPAWTVPGLSDIPVVGKALFSHQPIVYLAWIATGILIWVLARTRIGLVLKAVGESPAVGHAIGYPVNRIRTLAVLFGGGMAGLGGAYLSVFYTPMWTEDMVAGRGWIALALVVFATWRPWRVVLGAHLFGGVLILQLFVQSSGLDLQVPSQLLSAMPYLATIVVLVLIAGNPKTIRIHSPASLGKPFRPDAS